MEIKSFENNHYKDDEIFVDAVSVTYGQNADCSGEDNEAVQEITLTTRNNGVARFLNIKTESWSFEDVSDMEKIIRDFKQRAELN